MKDESDFHVVSLSYSLSSNDEVTYNDPPLVEFETDEARFHLADAKLTCEMKVHLSTEAEARAVVEPVLRAWELDADLRRGRGELRFKFEDAELIDRKPMSSGAERGHVHLLAVRSAITATATASLHVTRRVYPEPPCNFRITPDVATLWNRYQGYLDGREPLLAMAYFCLTLLESLAGGRTAAAAQYNIEERVLRKLGELTSQRGDHLTARKMKPSVQQPLLGKEAAWIETAIKHLIWRVGDQRSHWKLPLITMGNLPCL